MFYSFALFRVTILTFVLLQTVIGARKRQLIDCFTTSDCTRHPHLKHFSCIYGKCNCDEEKGLLFDKTLRNCAKLAGHSCEDEIPCVSNAYCKEINSTCTCNSPEYSSTPDGQCKLSYGQSCSATNILKACNPYTFLRCNLETETCTCVNDDEQIYDHNKKSCVGRPGKHCEFEEYSGILLSCIQNSSCIASNKEDYIYEGVCTCNSGLISTDSETCLAAFGSLCSLAHPCAKNLNLVCSNMSGRCECSNTSTSKTINGSEICVLKVNSTCESYEDLCVPHAQCTLGGTDSITCQCLPKYKPTQSMTNCKLDFGQYCTSDSECIETLLCPQRSRVCECKSSDFYWNGKTCVVKAGESCSNDNITLVCGEDASCINHTCVCKDKYAEINGKCHPGLGSICTSGKNGCAKNLHLSCTDGICNCDSETIPDPHLSLCRVKAGRECSTTNRKDICTSNSICMNNHCTCVSGYDIQSRTGLCKLSFRQKCSVLAEQEDCDEDKFIKCFMGKDNGTSTCGCSPNHEIYDNELKECTKLPNEYCGLIDGNSVSNQECVKNAKCVIITKDGLGICVCNRGYNRGLNSKVCEPFHASSSSSVKLLLFPVNCSLITYYSFYVHLEKFYFVQ